MQKTWIIKGGIKLIMLLKLVMPNFRALFLRKWRRLIFLVYLRLRLRDFRNYPWWLNILNRLMILDYLTLWFLNWMCFSSFLLLRFIYCLLNLSWLRLFLILNRLRGLLNHLNRWSSKHGRSPPGESWPHHLGTTRTCRSYSKLRSRATTTTNTSWHKWSRSTKILRLARLLQRWLVITLIYELICS
jgi:hypothetical protein